MQHRKVTLEDIEDPSAGVRNCIAYTFRLCSFCSIFFGMITLTLNLMQIGEIEFGNPEGDLNITNYKAVNEHANAFMDSKFYQSTKNISLLPEYEAIALDFKLENITDANELSNIIEPIGKVVYEAGDARFFVFLYFVTSILTLAFSCVCWNTGGINFELNEDAKSASAMIAGNLSREDARGPISESKELATVGYYSKRVSKNKVTLLLLMITASIVDATKLFYQSKAVEADLIARYGKEYLVWHDVAIDNLSVIDALSKHHCNGRRLQAYAGLVNS